MNKNNQTDAAFLSIGELISALGQSVAQGQQEIDAEAISKTLEIYSEMDDAKLAKLRELGYQPTFYAIPETSGEIRLSLGVRRTDVLSEQSSPGVLEPAVRAEFSREGLNDKTDRFYVKPVEAGDTNRYGFRSNLSSKMTFKIRLTPPPPEVENLRVIPQFEGLSVDESLQLAEELDLIIEVRNLEGALLDKPNIKKQIISQDPAPGHLAAAGDSLRLTVE